MSFKHSGGSKRVALTDINGRDLALESNGGVPVNVQDQTSQPVDNYFNQSISNFSLAADTVASTVSTMEYTLTANPLHGILLGDEILLLDVPSDNSLQCVVTLVVGDVITIDRPIDHVFPAATALGRIVTSNMAVLGSLAAPQIFTFRAGVNPVDVVRIFLTGLDDSSMDYTKFLGIPALTNGLVLRICNGFQKTIYCFKTNQEIAQFCYDVNLEGKAPAGQYGFASRISFGGQDKHGVVIRLSGTSVLQWIVQDDLTALINMFGSVEGHRVTS